MQPKWWPLQGWILFLLVAGLRAFSPASAQVTNPREFIQVLDQARRLTAEKKWVEASHSWTKLTEQNPVNGEYWGGLAHAYYYLKEYTKSIEAYKRQIELGYGLTGNAAYNIACCYALSGQKEKALEWLEKALYTGFNNLSLARTDYDLQTVRNEPKFKKLTGTHEVNGMGRTEGWRYDMELLKQEVLRKAYIRRDWSLDDFNRRYDTLYRSVDQKTDVELMIELMKLMVTVNDGHTSLFPPSRKEFQVTLPVQFYLFREGLYIIAADPKYKHLLGHKVIRFENKTVAEVSQVLTPLISRDNEMGVLQNLPSLMRYTVALQALGITSDAAKAELQVQDTNGKLYRALLAADTTQPRVDHKSVPDRWVTLHRSLPLPVPLYLKNTKATYWFEPLPGSKTVYLQWNSVRNDKAESLNGFTDRLMKFIQENNMDKLVIDLRWNNGGNTMLLSYFINAVIKNEKINKRGSLFVITGRRTYSAAQNLATFLERHTAAIFVGEPTGSRPNFVGEEDFITLPYSKLALNVSDLYWQSSWPGDKRSWIAPLIYTPPTFKAYNRNKDEALEAILDLTSGVF